MNLRFSNNKNEMLANASTSYPSELTTAFDSKQDVNKARRR